MARAKRKKQVEANDQKALKKFWMIVGIVVVALIALISMVL